jgi:hypothetical protein
MQSLALTPEDYLNELAEDRRNAMQRLRNCILNNLPVGFAEVMSYGMIGYVVPHTLYPAGYHCDPKLPLPFLAIASQKNFIAVYHMGFYTNLMLDWFKQEYAKQGKAKLDMGKSCLRFKKAEQIPFDLIGELASKMTVNEWIDIYESQVKRSSK